MFVLLFLSQSLGVFMVCNDLLVCLIQAASIVYKLLALFAILLKLAIHISSVLNLIHVPYRFLIYLELRAHCRVSRKKCTMLVLPYHVFRG